MEGRRSQCESDASLPTTAWWQQQRLGLRQIRSSSQLHCSIRSIVKEDCRTEEVNGQPVRKCERYMQRFRECPGCPPMELESSRECSTDSQEATPPTQHSQSTNSALLQQDVATFLQEFNLFAEELQYRAGKHAVAADSEASSHPAANPAKQAEQWKESWLHRMFPRWRAGLEPGENAPQETWHDLADKFQDI